MDKKWMLLTGAVLGIILIGVMAKDAFFELPQKPVLQTSDKPFRVARYYWPGMYWIEIADHKGWFAEAGLNVQLVDTNPDYFKSLQEMADGKLVDSHAFSLFDILYYNSKGSDLVLVINADNSFGVEAVVAKSHVKTLADLRGKTVGVSKKAYTEYILTVALSQARVPIEEVTLVDAPVERLAQDFIDNKFDAIVTWEPDVSTAIKQGDGHSLFDTSMVRGISPNGQAMHQSFIEERSDDVQAYVNVWHRTTEYIRQHPQEAYQIIADIYKTTWQEAQDVEKLDQIQTLNDNLNAFTIASGLDSLHGSLQNMNRFMNERGVTSQQFDSTKILNDHFVHVLSQNLQHVE